MSINERVVSFVTKVMWATSLRNGYAHQGARIGESLLGKAVGRTASAIGVSSKLIEGAVSRFGGAIAVGILVVISLSACAPLRVDQMPVREQRDFLRDIKRIVDTNDLADISSVSRLLGVDFVVKREGDVYVDEGLIRLGYETVFEVVSSRKEYRRGPGKMDYSILLPADGSPRRIRVGVSINTGVICISSMDLLDVFGEGRRYPITHGGGWEYLYLAQEGVIESYFKFYGNGCLAGIGLRQGNLGR
ncbi:hypothetical protein [Burkholderia cepacia]|uniref:hypothetical protein n=1 Tax=Burkholderia cepacia TaxID=292 RepID=UPI003D667B83